MARDSREYDVGGELRDAYGRSEYVLTKKHTAPIFSDSGRGYSPTDADGRVQIVIQDSGGNDLTTTLVSSKSQSSPVLFADSYMSAATDTAGLQMAMNAASVLGALTGSSVTLKLTPGKTYTVSNIQPKSGVMVEAYGATIKLNPASTFGVFDTGSSTSAPTNFHLRGGFFQGTGSEAPQQVVFRIEGGKASSGSAVDVSCCDIKVDNWATGPIYFANCIRARANFNTITNCCNFPGTNAINLNIGTTAGSGSLAYHECQAIGNYIDGCSAEGISLGETGNTYTGDINAIIAANVVICNGSVGGPPAPNCPINIEWSTATSGLNSRFIVANNHCTYNGTYAAASGIGVSVFPASNNNPLILDRIIIIGNTVVSNQRGIVVNGSDAIITGNHVEQTGTAGFGLVIMGNGTFIGTGDIASGTPTVNNVSAALSNVPNGTPIVAAGIPAGAYLLSGSGTATWTLSQNATATTTGVSITARSQIKRVNAHGNTIHAAASPTNPLVHLYALRDSVVTQNIVTCEAGSATTPEGIFTQYCGWVDITDNRVDRAPGHGIRWNISNDILIARNHIYNPSEGAASGFSGISLNNTDGTLYRIEGNICIDDRAVHQMDQGVALASGVPTSKVELLNNEIRGARVAPTTGVTSFGLIRNNTTDATTWPAATSAPAAPASGTPTTALPYPVVYYVTGGTVTHISLQRPGSSSRDMSTSGPVTAILAPGDTMTITYTVAPTLMLEPLQI